LQNEFHNFALAGVVTGRDAAVSHTVEGEQIIRLTDAIFQEPVSNFGRARLFTPLKMLNRQKTDTLWFNLSVIWMFSAIFYLLVLFDAPSLVGRRQ